MSNQLTLKDKVMTNDTSIKDKKHDLVLSRIFDAPIEEVWKAWSDPNYVMQWWGPKGFTSPLARME